MRYAINKKGEVPSFFFEYHKSNRERKKGIHHFHLGCDKFVYTTVIVFSLPRNQEPIPRVSRGFYLFSMHFRLMYLNNFRKASTAAIEHETK